MLDDEREVSCTGFDEKGRRYDEAGYKAKVLDRAPKSRFRASLLWLVDVEAITLAQAVRLDEIYDHRHDLTHELPGQPLPRFSRLRWQDPIYAERRRCVRIPGTVRAVAT